MKTSTRSRSGRARRSRSAPAEIADVVIVLYRLASELGVDLLEEIDHKMQINRARQWHRTGDGHGYHVREKTAP